MYQVIFQDECARTDGDIIGLNPSVFLRLRNLSISVLLDHIEHLPCEAQHFDVLHRAKDLRREINTCLNILEPRFLALGDAIGDLSG